MTHTLTSRPSTLLDQVIADTPGKAMNLKACLQCGTCAGSCPSGPDMDYSPRAIFAMLEAGMDEQVLKSNTPWFCVSCYHCMVRCPQEIPITDIMYTLKRRAIAAGYYREPSQENAAEFSETFCDFVENSGRSFELGIAMRYHLRHHPLGAVKMATGMGMKMLSRGRMDITPTRIKNIDQLKSILKKAKELGGEE
ncbi:MAG: 4Fe-4S dicluster domain-containing protein [Anaerolineales bacterium]